MLISTIGARRERYYFTRPMSETHWLRQPFSRSANT